MRTGFRWPVRVYYEDTDSAGIVYYASYLRFMERARTEWLRSLGFESSTLRREAGLVFSVVRLSVDYVRPARLDDALEVSVVLARCARASFDLRHEVTRARDEILARAEVRIACVDSGTLKPRRIPQAVNQELVVES